MNLLISTTNHIDPDIYRAMLVVSMILAFMKFLLVMFQQYLDYKLKNNMIEKGITDDVAAALMHKDPKTTQKEGIKWVILLLSTSMGIFVVNQVRPLGLHSLAIILASVAIGYMAYLGALKAIESE